MVKKALLLLTALIFMSLAHAEVKLMVVTEDWRPYQYLDENGKIVGRASDKVRAILDEAKISYDIQLYPWVRAMKIAEEQPNTMIFSIFRTAEREARFHWVCPLLEPVKEYFFKRKDRTDIKVESLEDAKRYVTSVVKGSVAYTYLLSKGFTASVNLDVDADPSAIPRKLMANRIDLTVATEYTLYESLLALGESYNDVERLIQLKNVDNNQACMAFNLHSDKDLIQSIQTALLKYNLTHRGP
ncbi:substrate-binding periplasmic protein [Pseudoalteromonas fenneropenaei]|uniref:Substrate-binding periplasmic protein n=1 Tax=Pseudoalteromonas fenneropenaei TaxID=1737459 RepID=A0ABV7CG62_9GAMM